MGSRLSFGLGVNTSDRIMVSKAYASERGRVGVEGRKQVRLMVSKLGVLGLHRTMEIGIL